MKSNFYGQNLKGGPNKISESSPEKLGEMEDCYFPPSQLIPVWSPQTHYFFSSAPFNKQVVTILLCGKKGKTKVPKFVCFLVIKEMTAT